MPFRHLPVAPDLDQLKHQAKDLLRAIHNGDPAAVAELREFQPDPIPPQDAKLADAQLVLARSYYASSWTRLVQAMQLVDAIWKDDLETVRDLVTKNPHLIHEDALMSAIDRAALQGKIGTARMLHEMAGRPFPPDGSLGGPAYTLSASGTRLILELGGRVYDDSGKLIAPVAVVLETDSRRPEAKHAILEMYAAHGVVLPDTAPMALHRGRIDLLEEHLRRDPDLLTRTFTHREIYPTEMGSRNPIDATVWAERRCSTCAWADEMEIARWLLDKSMSPNLRSAVGANGFGRYTPLFATVVSQPNFWMNFRHRGPFVAPMTELLLERGADRNVRASIWKQLHPGHGETSRHEYRDVSALSWGRRFHDRVFVSKPAMELIEAAAASSSRLTRSTEEGGHPVIHAENAIGTLFQSPRPSESEGIGSELRQRAAAINVAVEHALPSLSLGDVDGSRARSIQEPVPT